MRMLDQLFRSEEVDRAFSEQACLQGMLRFEAALARSEARAGVIPLPAAEAIAAKCKAALFDMAELSHGAALAGNLAIPLIKALTTMVEGENKEAARYVHWGATSQDAIDTGLVLQLGMALIVVSSDLDRLAKGLAEQAAKHRSTIMVGRTWMQQALPTTFGAIVAGWLDAVQRHRERLRETQRRTAVLQFGGAVGTLAALHERGTEVAKNLAEELEFILPETSWHSHRDRFGEVATTLGLCVGTLGKVARDISLLAQTEIAEVFEPSKPGRGVSSTMPHKRNPVGSAVVLAAAMRVPGLVSTMLTTMVQEQERGLGGWHAEWETLPQIVQLVGGAAHVMAEIVPGLEVDAERMRKNLGITNGLIYAEAVTMALAEEIGKAAAHAVVEGACAKSRKEKRHLREILIEDKEVKAHLPKARIETLFDAEKYLGMAQEMVDRVLAGNQASSPRR